MKQDIELTLGNYILRYHFSYVGEGGEYSIVDARYGFLEYTAFVDSDKPADFGAATVAAYTHLLKLDAEDKAQASVEAESNRYYARMGE